MTALSAFAAAATAEVEVPLAIDTGYDGRGVYRYCPAVVDAGGVRHVFYCRNKDAYSVVDYIWHATLTPAGELAGETVVLAPADSAGVAWDSYHVCDPSVIAGMKAAFTVYDGSYWGLGADPDGGATNVWLRLPGKSPMLDAKVAMDCAVFRKGGRDWVSYAVGGETLATFGIHLGNRTVATTSFCGNGTVSSLAGICDGDASDGIKISIK